MGPRKTSVEAYRKIKQDGLLSQRKEQVYELVYEHGPISGNELIYYADKKYRFINSGIFVTRLSELERVGAIEVVGEKIDPKTGRQVLLWDVTGKLPHVPKPKSRLEKLKERKDKIVMTLSQLEKQIKVEERIKMLKDRDKS